MKRHHHLRFFVCRKLIFRSQLIAVIRILFLLADLEFCLRFDFSVFSFDPRCSPFPCARLNRLPFDATLEDILILFQGLVVIDVVLVGQGEAFVIFANPMDYQMALQRYVTCGFCTVNLLLRASFS
jgi:hypothetical protein